MEPAAVSVPTDVSLVNRALVLLGDAPISSLVDGSTQATIASQFYGPAFEEFCGSTAWRWAMRTATVRPHFLDVRPSVPFWPPSPLVLKRFVVGDLTKKYVAPDMRYYVCQRSYLFRPTIYPSEPDGYGPIDSPLNYWKRIDNDPVATAQYLDVLVSPSDPRYAYEYVLPSDFLTLNKVDPQATHELAVSPKNYNADESENPTTTELVRVLWSTGEIERIFYSAKVAESEMPPHAQETFVYKLAHLLAMPVQANRARSEFFYELYMKSLRRTQAIDARQRPNANIVENGVLASDWDNV